MVVCTDLKIQIVIHLHAIESRSRVLFVLVNQRDLYDMPSIVVIFCIMLAHLDLKVELTLSIGAMCSSQDKPTEEDCICDKITETLNNIKPLVDDGGTAKDPIGEVCPDKGCLPWILIWLCGLPIHDPGCYWVLVGNSAFTICNLNISVILLKL